MVEAKSLSSRPPRSSRVAGAPPGPRRRDERLGALLNAACELFVEKGSVETSIDDIVVRAGVAKGTFYHYFQDRAAMLEMLRKRYAQHFAEEAQAAMESCAPGDWQALLDAWIGAFVREYLTTHALHDAIFHEPKICHRWVMGEELVVQILGELIERGRDAGVWDTDDPLATAVCMFYGAHGSLDEAIASGTDTGSVAPRLSRLFANMLRPN